MWMFGQNLDFDKVHAERRVRKPGMIKAAERGFAAK
jgi:hypothetical protein